MALTADSFRGKSARCDSITCADNVPYLLAMSGEKPFANLLAKTRHRPCKRGQSELSRRDGMISSNTVDGSKGSACPISFFVSVSSRISAALQEQQASAASIDRHLKAFSPL
jgi:hypothetical protein